MMGRGDSGGHDMVRGLVFRDPKGLNGVVNIRKYDNNAPDVQEMMSGVWGLIESCLCLSGQRSVEA